MTDYGTGTVNFVTAKAEGGHAAEKLEEKVKRARLTCKVSMRQLISLLLVFLPNPDN
jgi:hypothetical protein